MRRLECDIDTLWQSITYSYETRGKRVPRAWRWFYRMTQRVFAWKVGR